MSVARVLLTGLAAAALVFALAALLRVGWLILGAYRIRRAGPRRLLATHHTLWRDPGAVESLDLGNGPGGPDGAPVPPFTFLEEHSTGSQPCISVTDARLRRWRV